MSKFLEIGEILDLPIPKISVVPDKITQVKYKESSKLEILTLFIGIGVVVTITYLIQIQNEKSSHSRNES